METFALILIMLVAVLLSNIINRFLPFVAVPVIQILLGVVIAALPVSGSIALDPDLFFILFVAPLVYVGCITADRKVMWSMKGQIVNTAVLLVIFTCVVGGLAVNWTMSVIPIAAAITLIASLGPTDDVSVASMGKRFQMTGKMMELLQGESVFNDVSALICFQIGLTTVVFGSFSATGAIGQFLLAGIGGVAVGLGYTLINPCLSLDALYGHRECYNSSFGWDTNTISGVLFRRVTICQRDSRSVFSWHCLFH